MGSLPASPALACLPAPRVQRCAGGPTSRAPGDWDSAHGDAAQCPAREPPRPSNRPRTAVPSCRVHPPPPEKAEPGRRGVGFPPGGKGGGHAPSGPPDTLCRRSRASTRQEHSGGEAAGPVGQQPPRDTTGSRRSPPQSPALTPAPGHGSRQGRLRTTATLLWGRLWAPPPGPRHIIRDADSPVPSFPLTPWGWGARGQGEGWSSCGGGDRAGVSQGPVQ